MPNTQYQKGVRLERRTLKILRSLEDHIYSTRTPGSKTSADIVAILRDRKTSQPRIILIQCKAGKPVISRTELDFLYAIREMGVGALVVYQGGRDVHFWSLETAEAKMRVTPPQMRTAYRKRTKESVPQPEVAPSQ